MDNATFNRLARLYAYMWYNYRQGISGITYSIDMHIPDDIVDENYYDNEQIIIVDDDDYLLELLGRLGIKIDAEAFKNGDCVVFCDGYTYASYCLNNYAIPSETDSDEVFLLNIPEEVTIKSGDTLYFDCYAGSLTATVGAKLSYAASRSAFHSLQAYIPLTTWLKTAVLCLTTASHTTLSPQKPLQKGWQPRTEIGARIKCSTIP